MLSFTLIAEFNTPVAILCETEPNPGQRSILFGLIRGLAFNCPELAARWEVAAVLCTPDWLAEQLKRTPMLKPKGSRLAFLASLVFALCHLTSAIAGSPSQGSGAADLVRKTAPIAPVQSSAIPALPTVNLILKPTTTQTWYFAATAVATNGLESDYSSEVRFTATNRRPTVTLAWDPSPGTNTGLRYNIYTGGASRAYTNVTAAGTNLMLAVPLFAPQLTNIVLVFSTTGTNLSRAAVASGPFLPYVPSRTSLTLTNPAGALYFRSLGGKLLPPVISRF